MGTRRTKEQIRKDNYNKDVDAYNFYVVNLDTMRAETGFEFKEDAVDLLNDYDDKKKYKVVSKRALKSMGVENPNESFKYEAGGTQKSILKITPISTKRDSKGFRFYSDNTGNKLYAEKDNKIYNVNDDLKVIGEVPLQRVRFVFEGIVSDEDVKNLDPLHYEVKTIKKVREQFGLKNKYNNGGRVGLIGNQKRIDLNKNGKIDAEDFKLLRSSMNGAYRNERKHVNHNENYEVRYARNKPSRTGYKGKRDFAFGGMFGGRTYSTGRAYTNDKKHVNHSEEHEVKYIKKHPNQKRHGYGGMKYNVGGSLENHGLKKGDRIIKTIDGGIQQVKDKDGKTIYVNLANGERSADVPLPFNDGGSLMKSNEKDNYDVVVKINDKLVTKKDFDGFSKKEIIEWCEDRGWKNNEKAEKQGGSLLKNYEFFVKKVNTYSAQLPKSRNKYDDGGEVKYFVNKDGIRVRSKVEPKQKLSEKEWMAKHSESKEARAYAGGGDIKMVDGVMYERVKFSNGIEDWYLTSDLHRVNFYCKEHGLNTKNQKDFEKAYSVVTKRKMNTGGKVSFSEKSKAIARNFVGKRVEPKYQKEYGKTYDAKEAKEVGNKIAGAQKASYDAKAEKGAVVKKKAGNPNAGKAMLLAKEIRKDGEKWTDAVKRANVMMKNK